MKLATQMCPSSEWLSNGWSVSRVSWNCGTWPYAGKGFTWTQAASRQHSAAATASRGCGAGWHPNATRFSAIGNAAEVVGQTPWSARDAPVPPLGQRSQRLAGCEQADGGVGRGPGGPPHDLCRRPPPEKRVALAWQAARDPEGTRVYRRNWRVANPPDPEGN